MFNLKNKNHTQADSVRFSLHVLGVAILLMAFSLVFTNCSFLEDDGFFNKVENEVAVANADKMNVYIRHASIKFGKTQPADAALYQIKNNVEFSVTAMINEEYAFYRWAAFSTADFDITKQQMSMIYVNDEAYYSGFGAKELDSSVVKFENPRSETTKVRVMQTRNDIWLLPVVAERPKIKGTYPKTSQTPVRNSKLRVQFSKPMDETTFEGNFIISQGTYAADFSINETDITDKFQVEINESKNLATFSFRDAAEMFAPGVIIKLYFTEDIADSTGYTMQGSSSTRELEWSIGASVDTLPPLIIAMTAGTGNDCSKFSSTSTKEAERANSNIDNSLYDDNGVIFDKFKLNDKNEQIKDAGGDITLKHRVRDKVNIFVYSQDIAKADGERLESDVLMLGFRAKALTDLSGNALDSTQPGNFVADKIETYAGGENYSEISGKSFKAITGSSGGCIYTYDLSSLPDGLIQIQVYAYDATGNDGLSAYDPDLDDADGYGNGPRSLFIIKDTKAPDIATELGKIKSKSAAAPFGWYNKRSIDTIEVYDETANPIQDYGHPKLAAFHDDIKWVFNMGEGTEWNLPSTDPAWVSIKDKYKIGSASVETDGPVSITFRLMDDLGNISEAAGISSVLYDNTIPVSGEALCSDSSGNATLNSSATTKLTQYVKVPFTEELAGIKIIGITVTGPDGSPVTVTGPDGTQIPAEFNGASIEYAEGESGELKSIELDSDYDGTSEGGKQNFKNITDQYSSTVFDESVERLHVLKESYKTGTFYIKGLNLGEAEGIYTVTVTLYDAALNKAAEKQVKFSHDTKAPVLDSVVVQNVVGRTVYSSGAVDYWLPKAAYDTAKEVKFASLEVTATENGSGIKKITLGQNAFVTSESTVSVGGSVVEAAVNTEDNSISFSDYNNPVLYKTSGAITFVITGVRLDNPDSAGGNKISVELTDFVDNTGSNRDSSGNFILHPNSVSGSPIYAVYSDSSSPAIVAESPAPAIADGKADSASDETVYASARLASSFTDQAKIDLTLKLSPENYGSGVNVFTLSNGVFTAETKVFVGTSEIPASDYSLDGAKISFINYVFTGANEFKFTSVELQSPDGSQSVGITATDFTGWSSDEVSTNSIVLDRQAPVHGSTKWYVKEGVYGVSKSEVISNLALVVPFTEATSGVKIIKVEPKLHGAASSYATPFAATGTDKFKLWYVASESDITSTLLNSASNVTFTPNGDYITIGTPQTSGVFVMLNLKVDDTLLDNSTYDINVHLVDSALNGSTAEDDANATIPLTADTTSPKIKRIFINRLIARTLPGESTVDSYWVSSEDFTSTTPNKVEVVFTIEEKASGIQSIVLGGNLKLTNSSVITCDVPSASTETLEKGSDYTVSTDGTEIALADITVSLPKLINRDGDGSFTVTITNVELTGTSGEKSASVTLKDFALNSDANSTSSSISPIADDTTTTVAKIYVDTAAPGIYSAKLADRGGAAAIASRPDETNKTEAQPGYTNENLVNLTLRSTYSSDGATKRSGIKKLVLTSGATFTAEGSDASKFYYKDLTATSNTSVSDTDAASDGTGYTEITGVTLSEDKTVAILPYSYACSNVCMFIVTNVELSESDGSKTVSIRPLDLVGWQGSNYNNTITLDTTKPVWGTKPITLNSSNDDNYIYPKKNSTELIIFDDEIYFYKRYYDNTYLDVNLDETNENAIYYVQYAKDHTATDSEKSSAEVIKNTSATKQTSLKNIAFLNKVSVTDYSPYYIIALIDKAGNISETTQIVHCVRDDAIETKSKIGSGEYSLQYKMKYVDDYDSTTEGENGSYKVFETGKICNLAADSTNGVPSSGYPVFFHRHETVNEKDARVIIDLKDYLERTNTKTASGIAYYAVSGTSTVPSSSASNSFGWNSWIPYNGNEKISIYPRYSADSGALRLWFKDNVGNTGAILVANGAGLTPTASDVRTSTAPDVWLKDKDAPTIDNGFQPTGEGYEYDYQRFTPEGVYYPNGDVYTGSPINVNGRSAADKNRIFYTDTALYKTSKSDRVATDSSKTPNASYYGVRVILYPYTGSGTPSRDSILDYMDSHTSAIKYFAGETADITGVPFPKDDNLDVLKGDHFIYVVCQDAVGNMKIEKLKYECGSGNGDPVYYSLFVRDNTPPEVKLAADDTIVLPYSYSSTSEDFSGHGNWTNTQENFQKLCPPNAGYRVWYDSTKGTNGTVYFRSPNESNPYSYFDADKLLVDSYEGANTSRNADGVHWDRNKKRPFFYIDIDKGQSEDNLFAFYYSASGTHFGIADTKGRIKDIGEPDYFSNWGCGNIIGWSAGFGDRWMNLYKGKITTSILGISEGNGLIGCEFTGKVTAFVEPKNDFSSPIYLHILDKAGWATTVSMGTPGTIWENDITAPSVAFNGTGSSVKAGLNDDDGLYRMDAAGSTSLTLTFSGKAETEIASGPIKVYIPKDVASDAGSGIWGYSWTRNIDGIKTDDSGKPYLEFSGSSSALKIGTAKTFYIYDNVGNWTACSLTSSIDSTPPEISMSFGNYDTYTTGAIADKDGHVIQLSESSTLSGGSYGGTYTTESSETNPFTIYSNARTASSSDGMILGYFTAKDKNGNEETTGTYLGKITQVIVKTHVITTSGTSAGVDVSDIVAPYFTTNTTTNISTLNMPIYLDGSGNSSSDSTIKGTSFLGKLYEITIKDTGGNATTVWLKVLRDRTGPSVTSEVEALTGGMGDPTASSTKNRYYNKIGISFTPSDSGVGSDSYSILGGTSASTVLNVGGNSTNSLTDGTAVSLTSEDIADLSSDKLAIKAYDKLGNASVTYLDGSSSASSSFTWIKDTVAPNITKGEKSSGNYASFTHTSGTSATSDGVANILYTWTRSVDGRNEDIKLKFTGSDLTTGTATGLIKGFFISKTPVTEYDSQTLTSNGEFTIKPQTYFNEGENTGYAYCYAVDYAGNISNAYKIKIEMNTNAPIFTEDTITYKGTVESDDGTKVYFNKNTTIEFSVKANIYAISKYGFYQWDGNADIVIANTETNVTGHAAGTSKSYTISLNDYDETSSILPYVQVVDAVNNAKWIYKEFTNAEDKKEACVWYYDAAVGTPGNVSVGTSSGLYLVEATESTPAKVCYSGSVTELNLNVTFPDDPTGIKGYKLNSADAVTTVFSTAIGKGVSDSRGVTVPVTSTSTSVKIYAVDGLGNVSETPLTVNLQALTNAPDVTGIDSTVTAEPESSRAEKSATSTSTIYIDGSVTSVTVTPTYVADSTGTKGFADSDAGAVQEGTTFTITVTDDSDSEEGQTCNIYAVNGLGLYSAAPYTVTIKRDKTGPVVSEITLTKPEGKGLNYVSADGKLYYNDSAVYISSVTASDAGFGMPVSKVYAITTEKSGTPAIAVGTEFQIGERSSASNELYIAAVDALGTVSYTPLNKIKVNIAGTDLAVTIDAVDDDSASFTFAFDTEKPDAPTVALTNPDLSGNGAYFVETNAEGHEATLYFNTTLLGSAEISFTPSSADTGLAGFFVGYESTNTSYTALSDTDVTVDLSKEAARIYAVDKAGNISSPYTVTLKPDTVAAKTLEQITGDSGCEGSIYLVTSYGGSIIYYESGLKLKVNLEANESPITAYALVVGGSDTAPDDSSAWEPISVAASDGKTAVALTLPNITELGKTCALWVKDAVGNTKAYSNPNDGRGNALGDPKNLRNKGALKDTWWHLYDSSAFTLTNSMGEQTLKLSGFSTHLPVKSLKFSGFILGDDNMPISKVLALSSDGSKNKEITISNKSISKTAGVYELSLGSAYAFDDLEITFDKGNFYFAEGAKVTFVTVKDEEVEFSLTPSVTSPTYSYSETDFELTVSGLMPQYKMNKFILTGLSFADGTEDANKAIDSITIVKGETETAATSYNFTVGEDGTYTIQFNDGCNADSLKIKFKAGQTLADSLSVTMKRWTEDEAVTLPLAAASNPAPSIFGRFFDNVSSGISSIFTGRSMTHEERMALKEAKAAKKAALAAEKAAKKAAKKAARDAKKNAELASAEQGQSWTGLSSEFDSASSELDSAVSKMNSNASQTASQAQISSKKSVLKVKKTGVKSSESASAASAAEMSSKESASGNRLIYILAAFASLAVCGGAATVLIKKMRRR